MSRRARIWPTAQWRGTVAIGVYWLKKTLDSRAATRSATRTLYNEIKNNMRHREPDGVDTGVLISRCAPSMQVYLGLLHTGNIQYFDDAVQKKLADLYCAFLTDGDGFFVMSVDVSKDLERLLLPSLMRRIAGALGRAP